MARYRPVRQHRYNVLGNEGFTKAERQALSEFAFNLPYIKLMRQDRRELLRDARKEKLSAKDFRSRIEQVYYINDWKDAFAMMRDYRNRSIERGEYPERKPRKPIIREDLQEQRRLYHAKQRTRRAPPEKIPGHEEYIRRHRLQ